jgi:hypothetical protein
MFVVEYDYTACEGRGRDYVNSIEEVFEKLNYHKNTNPQAFLLKPIKIQVNYTEENA